MRAVRLHPPGGLTGLALEEVATPAPASGEALVRVHAAAITRDELDWPVDRLPAIPSYELSGVVVEVAAGVDGLSPGDAVFALTPFDRDGVAAEYASVPAGQLAPKPFTLDHVQSAAIPLAALSAWQGLFDHGHLTAGERVLIHGASGGVGHFAAQLARHAGAVVIDGGVSADVEPVDLVFDTAGGDALRRSGERLREGGRVVTVAEEAPSATYFVVEPNRAQLFELARLADAGELRPAIDSVFPLEDATSAFERSLRRGKQGKVVLRIG